MIRRFRQYPQIGGKKGGGISDGWVEVEWIKSDGTAYIDTGIVYNQATDSVEITFDVSPATAWNRVILGAYGNGGSTYLWIAMVTAGTYVQGVFANQTRNETISGKQTVAFDRKSFVTSKVTWTYTSDYNGTNSLYLFGRHSPRGVDNICGGCPVYGFVARRNDAEILNLVGVRNATTNEVAMCDILTGDIYRNAGMGSFIAGSDKAG